jgi:hypothetical protein
VGFKSRCPLHRKRESEHHFKRMTDIEKRFSGNGDDGSLIERQLLAELV